MICNYCGKELPDNARFCPFCGSASEAYEKEPQPGRGLGIAGLVLGICSIVFSELFIGFACGIVGIVLSANALKHGSNGMAKAGLVLSIIGLALVALMVILAIAAAGLGFHMIGLGLL